MLFFTPTEAQGQLDPAPLPVKGQGQQGIALALYGADQAIWGGEVLAAGYEEFTRIAHLEYAPMPGGEAAIREPWRMALGYLAAAWGEEAPGIARRVFPGMENGSTI